MAVAVGWNRNVALWALNKSILNTIIVYGLEGPLAFEIQSGSDELSKYSRPLLGLRLQFIS